MAKRKQKNVELERQMKQRKMIFRMVSIAVALVVVLAVGIGIWTVQDSRWILRYEGGRVAVNDFRAKFDLRYGSDPMARDMALEDTKFAITVRDRAIAHGVDFTAEERAAAEADVNDIRQSGIMNNGFDSMHFIDDSRVAELFFIDSLIERLTDIYVPAYNVDEEEFAAELEEYLTENIYMYMNMMVQFLITEEREEIEEAYALLGTIDFEEIVRQFTEGLEYDTEIDPMSALELADWFQFEQEDRDDLFALETGEYSRIIEWVEEEESLYFLFHMISREEPDMDEIAADYREDFINTRRDIAFNEIVDQWIEDANFTINQRGYNTI